MGSRREIKEIFEENGGILTFSEAKKHGIVSTTLYNMVEDGELEKISRGLFRLGDLPPLSNPDFVIVAKRCPKAVICLISALDYYRFTTQIPHSVYITLPMEVKKPKIDFPAIDVIWRSKKQYEAGLETVSIDNVDVKIYSKEKTITDCFYFQNYCGLDVALEALKNYLKQSERNLALIHKYAKINKIEKLITPYIEALI
jgi:predicted transcriptional regulator of viral defense system